MRSYEKPCMTVTCYNAMDNTNLKLNTSYAIGLKTPTEGMSGQSFTLHQ